MNLGEVKTVEIKFGFFYKLVIEAENNLRRTTITFERLTADEVKNILEMLKEAGGYDAEISYITPEEQEIYGKRFVIAQFKPAPPPMRSYVFYSSYENSPAVDGIHTRADITITEKGIYPEKVKEFRNVPVKVFTSDKVEYRLKSVQFL